MSFCAFYRQKRTDLGQNMTKWVNILTNSKALPKICTSAKFLGLCKFLLFAQTDEKRRVLLKYFEKFVFTNFHFCMSHPGWNFLENLHLRSPSERIGSFFMSFALTTVQTHDSGFSPLGALQNHCLQILPISVRVWHIFWADSSVSDNICPYNRK